MALTSGGGCKYMHSLLRPQGQNKPRGAQVEKIQEFIDCIWGHKNTATE